MQISNLELVNFISFLISHTQNEIVSGVLYLESIFSVPHKYLDMLHGKVALLVLSFPSILNGI